MSQYAQPDPAGSDRVKFGDHVGALVLIQPHEVTTFTFDAEKGPEDVVRSTVDVVDGPGAPKHAEGVLVGNWMLYEAIKGKVGEKVLGRVGKAGRSIKLEDHLSGDPKLTDAYLAKLERSTEESAGSAVDQQVASASLTPEALAALPPEARAAIEALQAQQK